MALVSLTEARTFKNPLSIQIRLNNSSKVKRQLSRLGPLSFLALWNLILWTIRTLAKMCNGSWCLSTSRATQRLFSTLYLRPRGLKKIKRLWVILKLDLRHRKQWLQNLAPNFNLSMVWIDRLGNTRAAFISSVKSPWWVREVAEVIIQVLEPRKNWLWHMEHRGRGLQSNYYSKGRILVGAVFLREIILQLHLKSNQLRVWHSPNAILKRKKISGSGSNVQQQQPNIPDKFQI